MPVTARPAIDRVYARIKVNPFGCWEWQGALNHGGYGIIQLGRGVGTDRVHRVVYEHEVGPLGDLTVDHLCLNSRCVNPSHLQAVTRDENARRQWATGRGKPNYVPLRFCKRGHEFTPENTKVRNGRRHCQACYRAWRASRK
jgi:hypothetical protein